MTSLHEILADFDAAYHKLRDHLVHALEGDSTQLAHDAEAEHDAAAIAQQAGADIAAAVQPAEVSSAPATPRA